MMNNKKIAVLMCTKNRETIMLRSIKCILNQTYKDFDFIIIDDCSTDNTKQVINKIQETYPQVKYYSTTYNKNGLINSRNLAFSIGMNYDYIMIIDSDDRCEPNKLEEQLKVIEETGADVVGCKIKFGNKTSNLSIPKTQIKWNNIIFRQNIMEGENISMLIHFPACLFRTSFIKGCCSNGQYFKDELINGGEDTCFLYWLYINGAKFENCIDSTYLYNFLEYEDSVSATVGQHFNGDNFVFKYIHDKPIADRLNVIKDLYYE